MHKGFWAVTPILSQGIPILTESNLMLCNLFIIKRKKWCQLYFWSFSTGKICLDRPEEYVFLESQFPIKGEPSRPLSRLTHSDLKTLKDSIVSRRKFWIQYRYDNNVIGHDRKLANLGANLLNIRLQKEYGLYTFPEFVEKR